MNINDNVSVDGGYHSQMESAVEPLRVMESYITFIKDIKKQKPLATWYGDKNGKTRYRNLITGKFCTRDSALELLSKQA